MKKNIFTVIITASTILNLALTSLIVFSVVPAMNKTNKLIDKVAAAIDLELDEGDEEEGYSAADLAPHSITFESKQTINLKRDEGDKDSHFVIIEGLDVSFNTKAEDYQEISELVNTTEVYITDIVKEEIAKQTITTLDENDIKEKALAKIQEFYKTKCIVKLSFAGYMFQ